MTLRRHDAAPRLRAGWNIDRTRSRRLFLQPRHALGVNMFRQSCLAVAVSMLVLIPAPVLAQTSAAPIRFKVTHTPRPGHVSNVHGACSRSKNDDDLLCSMMFVGLEYSASANRKSSHCTVDVVPMEPMKFKKQPGGDWEHTSSPNRLCGTVSTFNLRKNAETPISLGWILTISSKETDVSSPLCRGRKPVESTEKYSFDVEPALSCESLEFTPGSF